MRLVRGLQMLQSEKTLAQLRSDRIPMLPDLKEDVSPKYHIPGDLLN